MWGALGKDPCLPCHCSPGKGKHPAGSQGAPITGMSGISVQGEADAAGGPRQPVRAEHKISSLKPPVLSLLLVLCLLIGSY